MTTGSPDVAVARGAWPARAWAAGAGYVLLAAIVVLWSARALHDPAAHDMRPNYQAGQLAWSTGHPESPSFIGTPLLGALMALVTQVVDLRTASLLLTVLNTILVIAAVVIVLGRLRPLLPRGLARSPSRAGAAPSRRPARRRRRPGCRGS